MESFINLGDLKLATRKPRGSVIFDLISSWSSSSNRAHLGRLSAAAVGVCCVDRDFPVYDTNAALPLAYGGVMMDHLMDRGISPNEVIEIGAVLLNDIAEFLITKKEVQKVENFIEQPAAGV